MGSGKGFFFLLIQSGSVVIGIMGSGNSDSPPAIRLKLVGDNYNYWAYVMKNFILGKTMWDYVTGDLKMPKDSAAEKYTYLTLGKLIMQGLSLG